MTGSTSGRTVAITGAGRGLGLLTARTLLEQDSRVVANYRSDSSELDLLAKQYPNQLLLVQGDAADEVTAKAMVDAAGDLGGLDALIHNAAITRDGLAVRLSVEDWDEVMRVNLRGAFLATKHALRPMMRRRAGRIVYVSSTVAYVGNAGQTAYAASKAGLQGLALSVAQEYRGYNIRTVVASLGLLDTGLGADLADQHRERLGDMQLAGIGDPGQVAATLAFLTSSAADFINATVVRVDGGMKYG
jgi:3-oxoacyl-[acyl-carrier protein] reductase